MERRTRKPNRLKNYDYSQEGAYSITICTKQRAEILWNESYLNNKQNRVGDGALDVPENDIYNSDVVLSEYGNIIKEIIESTNRIYDYIKIEKYVIMPNHIHMILLIDRNITIGTSRAPSPTNAIVPSIVSMIKRFANKKIGFQIWQRSFHDHIIRSEEEYLQIWKYIDENPIKWELDDYYKLNID